MATTLPPLAMHRLVRTAIALLWLIIPLGVVVWHNSTTPFGGSLVGALSALGNSAWLTLLVTLTTSTLVLLAALAGARGRHLNATWASFIAVPHVAFAIGLLWLVSPSGWLVRLVDGLLPMWQGPIQSSVLSGKSTFTLMVVLVLKELPFLLLMAQANVQQMPIQPWQQQAQALGYSHRRFWWLIVIPALLKRIRLPLYIIAIYTVSVVDIPLLVGPNAPALLAHEVYQLNWQFTNNTQGLVSWGSLFLVVIAFVSVLLLRGLEWVLQRWLGYLALTGKRACAAKSSVKRATTPWFWALLAMSVFISLLLQSGQQSWFYPSLWPQGWQWSRWLTEWPYIAPLLYNTWILAALSATLAWLSAIALLEVQAQRQQHTLNGGWLTMLMIPQLVLVLGWQQTIGPDNGFIGLLWSHTVFCFPYAYLTLHGAYRAYPRRWLWQARSLGYGPWAAWFKVLVPMLQRPLALAWAMAFSISVAQYLPTQWLAPMTHPTLTTEAVSIASGGDWRLGSVYALAQWASVWSVFMLVLWGTRARN